MHRLNKVLTWYAINSLHKGFIGSSSWLTAYSLVMIRDEAVANAALFFFPRNNIVHFTLN